MDPVRARLAPTPRLAPPDEVRQIAATLERAGFETWCVGGAVRDALLGLQHLDWDLATSATPTEVKRTFRRTVPVGEQFGTIGVFDRRGRLHEVTTFRRDVQTDGRHAIVEFGASLEQDLARRDFTINAIAFSPSTGAIFDPFGGRDDLARGVVRAVGDARARMVEDRLRALRAMRFAGRFSFRIDDATWAAIVDSAPHLTRLSRERIKQELEKTMQQVRRPSGAMTLWRSSGALRTLLPALDGQPVWALSAADHRALPDDAPNEGHARRRVLVRLATLFCGLPHDVTRRELRELRFSNRDVDWMTQLATTAGVLRERVGEALRTPPADVALRRWASMTGRARLADTLRVSLATLSASGDAPDGGAGRALYRRALEVGWRSPVELADLAIDGEALMRQAGIGPGPVLGATLKRLLDLVLEDPSRNTPGALLDAALDGEDRQTSRAEGEGR